MPPIRNLLGPKVHLLVAIGYTVGSSIAFLMPGKDLPPTKLPIDKAVHALLHAVLFVIWASLLFRRETVRLLPKNIFGLFIACLAYGIIIEVLQENFVPMRFADGWDIVANGIGLLLGILVVYRYRDKFENQI